MPDFANLRRALLCQGEPARVPALEFAVDKAIKARFLGREPRGVEDDADFFLRAGYDIVPVMLGIRITLLELAAAGRQGPGHGPAPMRRAEAHYSANQSETSARLWAEERAGLIQTQSDFDNFPWPSPEDFRYQDVERLGQILPAEAKVVPVVGYVFAGSWMLVGFERFCLDLAEGGRLAASVVRRVGELHLRLVENLLEFDCVGAVCMPDDMAYTHSLMVSPRFLREHVLPWHKRIGELVRSKGLPYLLHCDGRYEAILDDLIECGYHAIHPCEPASWDIVDLKRRVGGRLCLCGNINLDSTLTRGTPRDVNEEVKLRIRTVGPGGGYCCGSSNSVTEYVPFENLLAMLDAIKAYGRYPIPGEGRGKG